MPSLDQPIELQRPPAVRFGAGQVANLADWIVGAGAKRSFVVTRRTNAARIDVIGHAVAYPLGTRHKLAHGLANALGFPQTLAANYPAATEKTTLIAYARALGFGYEGRQAEIAGARGFCGDLGHMALRNHGVLHADLPAAREAHAIRRLLDFNPVELSEADILKIYEAAY